MTHSRVIVRVSSWSILLNEVNLLTSSQAVQAQERGTLDDRGDDVKGSDLDLSGVSDIIQEHHYHREWERGRMGRNSGNVDASEIWISTALD